MTKKQRKKWFIPALCNLLGTVILLAVIASCLPVTIPRFLGYEVYNVVSGSMEPEIPVGSILFVEPVEAADVTEGEIIAFRSGESVITHRVTKNQTVEGQFTTKGDANEKEDMQTVPYRDLIGRVAGHYPVLGEFLFLYTDTVGKIYVLGIAACGVMLNMLAGRIRTADKLRRARGNG